MDTHGTCITVYTTYISVDLAHHEIFHAKVGKGGIKMFTYFLLKSTCTLYMIYNLMFGVKYILRKLLMKQNDTLCVKQICTLLLRL